MQVTMNKKKLLCFCCFTEAKSKSVNSYAALIKLGLALIDNTLDPILTSGSLIVIVKCIFACKVSLEIILVEKIAK